MSSELIIKLIVVILFAVAMLSYLFFFIIEHIKFKKWIMKKLLAEAFRQGSHPQRRWLLKNIVETVENEYTEDNWYSRTGWLVEEILKADDNVGKFEIDEGCVNAGLRCAVHDAIEYKKRTKV